MNTEHRTRKNEVKAEIYEGAFYFINMMIL